MKAQKLLALVWFLSPSRVSSCSIQVAHAGACPPCWTLSYSGDKHTHYLTLPHVRNISEPRRQSTVTTNVNTARHERPTWLFFWWGRTLCNASLHSPAHTHVHTLITRRWHANYRPALQELSLCSHTVTATLHVTPGCATCPFTNCTSSTLLSELAAWRAQHFLQWHWTSARDINHVESWNIELSPAGTGRTHRRPTDRRYMYKSACRCTRHSKCTMNECLTRAKICS